MATRSETSQLLCAQPVQVYKSDARSRVWRVNHPSANGQPMVIKRFDYSPVRQRLARCLGLHPAQRERRWNRRLRTAGFRVVPITQHGALVHGLGCRCWLATPYTGRSLQQCIGQNQWSDRRDRLSALRAAAHLTMDLIQRGYYFRDLKPSNILIDKTGDLWLIDVGGVRRSRRPAHAMFMLGLLLRKAVQAGLTRTDQLRFLHGLVARDPQMGQIKDVAKAIDQQVRGPNGAAVASTDSVTSAKRFNIDSWDHGRLRVNRDFAPILQANGLVSFDAFFNKDGGQIAKHAAHGRVTRRFVLPDQQSRPCAFYLKKQHPPAIKEYVRPLLRLTRPILNTTHEWVAMIRFHQVGIATMVPVAMGRHGTSSFVCTQEIEGCQKLSDWMRQHLADPGPDDLAAAGCICRSVARVAKTMHATKMHHQDFYLGHLMRPTAGNPPNIHVIDLGRVRCRTRLSRRWIIKDLAQLHYSAHLFRRADQMRFMRVYLGRRLRRQDKTFIRRVLAKSHAIARHTAKHRL